MDEQKIKLKYVIYRRKSSEADDRQTLSLDSQRKELLKYADKNNLKIIKDFEEAQSAYKQGRNKFADMVELIRQSKANAILVYHISRLARNMTDGGLIIDMLKDGLIIEVRTPTEVYTKNSGSEFILALQFAMSKKSSDDTSEFVRRDIKSKLIKGELPNFAPRGYLNIDKDGKIAGKQFDLEKQNALALLSRPLKRVEKDPGLAPLILKMFELMATGQTTLNDLRQTTSKWGLTGERSRKKLSKATIYRILTSPFYYGAIRWRGRIYEPLELPIKTRHDPIVNKELFDRVQEELGLRNRPIGVKRFYPYTNLIKCGVCGGNISGMISKGNSYYRCIKCHGLFYVRESELEEQIEKEIFKITIDNDFYNLALEEINKANEKEISNRDAIKAQQQKALVRCQTRLDNLLRLKISPENKDSELLNDEEFISQKRETLKEMSIIKEKMVDSDRNNQNWFNLCVNYVEFNKNLLEKFKNGTPQRKREIFQFVYYNPLINAKLLSNSEQSPHKFVMFYNERKQTTTTANNNEYKNKKDALASLCSVGRGQKDTICLSKVTTKMQRNLLPTTPAPGVEKITGTKKQFCGMLSGIIRPATKNPSKIRQKE